MRLRVNPPRLRPTKKPRRREVIAASRLAQFGMAGCAAGGRELARHRRRARLPAQKQLTGRARQSAKSDGFQVFISLDDFAQLVLGGAVAAIGVGMVALHQRFERVLTSSTDAPASSPSASSALRSALWTVRAHARRSLRRAPLGPPNSRNTPKGSSAPAISGWKRAERERDVGRAAVHAHLPGGAMADDRLFLILGDVVGVHPGKEIVRLVVLPHVIQAEPPIFSLAQPPLGRAVGCGRLAVRPIAGRGLGMQPTVFVGLDPDAVEQGGVVFHDRSLCARGEATFKS